MMYKRLPPLNSLKAFESSARHLSFTKAAEELFVTQAAVSHQIKLLEDFLGAKLFNRKNRALELTEIGQSYFIDIKKILHKLAEVTDKLLLQKDSIHLNISVPQTFGIHWLVPHLTEFNQRYPEIEVRIKGVDQDEGSLSEDIDIAIFYGHGDWQNLNVERLAEEELLMLASPKLLAEKPVVNAEDLQQHTLLHVYTRDNWQNMAELLQLENINIQHGPLFSHTFMALQAAVHGQGIVLANRILAQQQLENGSLTTVCPAQLKDPKTFYVVSHLNATNEHKIKAFRQWIMQTIQSN